MIVDLGMIKLKVAAEYIKYRGRDDEIVAGAAIPNRRTRYERGVGGGICSSSTRAWSSASMPPLVASMNANQNGPVGAGTFDILSFGGFANARITGDWIAGVGADFTRKADYDFGGTTKSGYYDHLQGFGALQYVVAKRLFIKAVFGYAQATFSPGGRRSPTSPTRCTAAASA